ncbi:type IV pilus modification PilV family protein [Cryobacterium arcticum]|uniref:Prepilin-type cleavage/methylation domain-containing protein n=1 Tax=Cryobacterium arcticum TaxID=670052 RepID=A0A317ZVK1_9MICO|nr:prepilin-type N-terminal cleavage/methylation domain-containing protein [Cryobacterium arcticum]PXA68704.1 prepilin-type cleavage/methylation domain-containing protein [Cryobacterium arcticum]
MSRIHARLGGTRDRDSGVTIIEIMVAMMVFAMIAVSVAYALTLSLSMGNDNRSREAAANLVAQEIDLNRAVEDLFTLVDADKTTTINGTTFHLHRQTNWVTSVSADATCGSGGGQLKYKRVNVSVTWDGMRASTLPVRADTVIAPGTRINDPTLGTILVSVRGSSGTGKAGVIVSAAPAIPAAGAATLTEIPDPTDAQGCSYILKVVPGNYNVTVSAANSVDVNQVSTPVSFVGVGAGAAASVAFQYDRSGAYTVTYASNAPAGSAILPTNLDTTFMSTYPLYTRTATTSAVSKVYELHPFASGYQIFSGKYVASSATLPGCLSPNPAEWTVPRADGAVGHAVPAVATLPGVPVAATVPMGLVTVTGLNGKFLKAVSQAYAPGTGAAGCGGTMNYSFGQLNSNSVTVALPYGAWRLTSGTALGAETTAVTSGLSAPPPSSVLSGVLTLDPRVVAP